jgi:two-component system, chemotaxis family, CheB/CheR fusion protein
MKICLVKSMDEYILRLQEQPEEIEALFQEMLINVTHFFRDPEAFQALIESAIRPLIMLKHAAHAPMRVWVAGCSSGEEAYSIAIAIQEQLDALKTECPVQIFATDLDFEAIAAARRGFYSEGSLENVSAERLQRFFQQEEDGYRVRKKIRDMVVFSAQNLISDPPFSKIDLLCCRNLLIYLEHELQKQLFLQFHYSLNREGILFLGNSESITGNTDLFAVIDRKHKIFQRKEAVTQRLVKTKTRLAPQRITPNELESRLIRLPGGLRELAAKVLLDFHTPASVIIDLKHNILFTHGRTGKYLEPASGETSNNLMRMAREGLKTELATAMHVVIANKKTVRREGVQVKTNGSFQEINLIVQPIEGPPEYGELIMVVFEEVPTSPLNPNPTTSSIKPGNARISSSRQIDRMEKELKEKDDYLHTIINELEDTNQDLKSTNEELQSINEEMQSSNEELETSKEELQSINEELSTINAELQNKNEELSGLNNDVYNLLASIEIGIIFLDMDLQIRRFTPTINKIYNFLPADIGRPIDHFVSKLENDHLIENIRQVLHDLVPRAIESQTKDGAWYLVNIKPYRTLENVIDGAVVTFVDISEQKRGDELRRLGTILRDSNDAVTVQDFEGNILAWNRGAAQMYGWTDTEALAINTLEMVPENKRAEVVALYQRIAKGESIHSFETQKLTQDGRTLEIWMTLTALVNDARQRIAVATTERDITGRKTGSQFFFFENRALKALNRWYQASLTQSETTPQSVAKAACRVLVEGSGYQKAWIGKVIKKNAKTTQPLAWAGLENGELESVMGTVQETVKRALSSRQPVVGQLPDALEHTTGSFLTLPILSDHGPLGVLVIYAAEPEAFVEPEVEALVVFGSRLAEVMDPELIQLQRQNK